MSYPTCRRCDPLQRWVDLIDLAYTNWIGPFYGARRASFAVQKPEPEHKVGDVWTVTGGPASMIGQPFRVTQVPERVEHCRVYWGSHGCDLPRGHEGPHLCDCALPNWQDYLPDGFIEDNVRNVGAPPYYGPDTNFYGEDVKADDGIR